MLPPPTLKPSEPSTLLLSPRAGSLRSLCLTSMLKASLSRNSFRSASSCRVGWAAILLSIFSRAARRDSTKLLSNRPTACFSGGGGTTTPGLLACSALYSHRKSRYRRLTSNSGCRYALDVVCNAATPPHRSASSKNNNNHNRRRRSRLHTLVLTE